MKFQIRPDGVTIIGNLREHAANCLARCKANPLDAKAQAEFIVARARWLNSWQRATGKQA